MNEADTGPASVYTEHRPGRPDPLIACRREQRIGAAPGGHPQRVLPDACADLIVTDGGAARLAGPTADPAVPLLAPHTRIRGLRLRTSAIGPALGLPAHLVRDADLPLDALLPRPDAERLTEQIWSGARPALPAAPPDPRVRAALRALSEPGATAAGAARAVGLSERQLRRLLLDHTGLGPRALQRTARLQRFLRAADADPGRPLADLALTAGYADQPHLTREVRRMSGLTPAALLAERTAATRPGLGATRPPTG
ncbi:helix-turn-helix domain-containing protein [Nocardiopsis potens]|uniref:helix-turn-helix domain-containing protein n=1 Tax=Nocardiopsis potens TaxID=1246458 RepID=UPI000345BEFC|nr:helix-turn-helix domain-containing protein [Nocardiopsis potens]